MDTRPGWTMWTQGHNSTWTQHNNKVHRLPCTSNRSDNSKSLGQVYVCPYPCTGTLLSPVFTTNPTLGDTCATYPVSQGPLHWLVVCPTAPHLPASHGPVQSLLLAPVLAPYRPGTHPTHTFEAAAAAVEYLPSAHWVHELAPAVL